MNMRKHKLTVDMFNFSEDLSKIEPFASDSWSGTDLKRLRRGKVGGQFWVAYISCHTQYKDAVQSFIEQIDLIHQLVQKYPDDLQWADSADSIGEAFEAGKVASLIGVEGGHAIGNSLAILRSFYRLGARYMSLTHNCNTPWADASPSENEHYLAKNNGLSKFGNHVVVEMNRLGMMIDLSHVSSKTMHDVLDITEAPVIFSHSGARAIANHTRNIPDDVLKRVTVNGGIVMVVFFPCIITNTYNAIIGTCNKTKTSIDDVIKHINHIRKIAGVDHIGIGSDYDGLPEYPDGLEDVSKFPKLFESLIEDPENVWTDEELEKVAGKNLLRVFHEVERVRDRFSSRKADNTWIEKHYLDGNNECSTKQQLVV